MRLGFQAVGIRNTRLDAAEAHLLQWLAHGHHGAIKSYLAKRECPNRHAATGTVSWPLRVISVRMNSCAGAVQRHRTKCLRERWQPRLRFALCAGT